MPELSDIHVIGPDNDGSTVPKHRTYCIAVIASTVLVYLTLVISRIIAVSRRQEDANIPLIYVDIWQIVLMGAAIICMAIFIIRFKHKTPTVNEESRARYRNIPLCHRIPLRRVAYVVISLLSLAPPFIACTRMVICNLNGISVGATIQFLIHALTLLFCVFQMCFIVYINVTDACHKSDINGICSLPNLVTFNISATLSLALRTYVDALDHVSESSNSEEAKTCELLYNMTNTHYNMTTSSTKYVHNTNSLITETLNLSYAYFQPFIIQFCFFSIIFLLKICLIPRAKEMLDISTNNSTIDSVDNDQDSANITDIYTHDESTSLLVHRSNSNALSKLKTIVITSTVSVCRNSIWLGLVLCGPTFIAYIVLHELRKNCWQPLYPANKNEENNNAEFNVEYSSTHKLHHSKCIACSYVNDLHIMRTVYTYVFSIITLIGYFFARRDIRNSHFYYSQDAVTLIVSAFGSFALILFELIASSFEFNSNYRCSNIWPVVVFFIKCVIHLIGAVCQCLLVIKCFNFKHARQNEKVPKYIRGLLVLLMVYNIAKWLGDSFMPPAVMDLVQNEYAVFGHNTWLAITRTLMPMVLCYRITTVILCYEIIIKIPR